MMSIILMFYLSGDRPRISGFTNAILRLLSCSAASDAAAAAAAAAAAIAAARLPPFVDELDDEVLFIRLLLPNSRSRADCWQC